MNYPLGTPTNRPAPSPALTPIPDRPNWYTNAAGGEVYVEPPKLSPWAKYIKTLSGAA